MAPDAETKERGDIARLARILKLILGQLLLLVLVLIAVVFAGEWYARKKFPDLAYVAERQQRPEDLFVQFDARYGWANRPGADTRFRRRDFDTHVEINERGFRGPVFAPPDSVFSVAVLGDSYVFGHGVEEKETFSALLREKWPFAAVGNFGVIGYSTDQELLLLDDVVLPSEPDVVLLCLYRNDILDNGQPTAWGIYQKPYFKREANGELKLWDAVEPSVPLSMRIRREIQRRFVLYDVLAFRLAGLRAESHGEDPAAASGESGPSESERLTADLIDTMASKCEARGVRFLLVVLPGLSDTAFLAGVPPPGVGSRLDLAPAFEEYERLHPDSALGFTYDSHWNPRGHRLVADTIAAKVEALGWLPGSGSPSSAPSTSSK